MDLNLSLYLSLFLILVGLFVFSLVRRKLGERDGQNEAAGPEAGATGSGPDDAERGE